MDSNLIVGFSICRRIVRPCNLLYFAGPTTKVQTRSKEIKHPRLRKKAAINQIYYNETQNIIGGYTTRIITILENKLINKDIFHYNLMIRIAITLLTYL